MNKFLKEIKEWILLIVVSLAVALFVTNFLITNSYIPTQSMESTLPVGSRLFGFRLYYSFADVKRGDVVIFDYGYECKNCHQMYQKNDEEKCYFCNTESKGSKKVQYIKRVIGLPGDHIEIKADYITDSEVFKTLQFKEDMQVPCGHVYVNGEMLQEKYLNEPMIVDSNRYKSIDIVVPENSYFLLGDNRNNSEDARFWPKHFIEKKDILSKALILYWPLYKIGIIK